MINTILAKVIGTKNERELKGLRPRVAAISEKESLVQSLSDSELRTKTAELRERLQAGASVDDVLNDAFAVVREAGRRVLNMRHFDVQLIGGMVLHQGKIAEMKTGEGKTLVATLAAYLNALEGKGVHVVTVNDYLARRDAEWMGRLYRFLGMSVGVIQHEMTDQERQLAYQADISYGTNNEFGFDYLRDNMKFDLSQYVQRGHGFAIVDEVDSILIDEARTPLIISGPAEESTELYYEIDRIIPRLKPGAVTRGDTKAEDREALEATGDFLVDEKHKTVTLTEDGMGKCEKFLAARLQAGGLYDPANMPLLHHINQGLRAHSLFKRDVDYMVKDGQVVIVDEFTGRLMPGRRWSDGLHQAVEAKEKVKIERENQTLATVTFQNYFRKYKKLAGMTGTADTEATEFAKIYNLDVVVIPTNRTLLRTEHPDLVYRTEKEKYDAVVNEIVEMHEEGRPVLVGTVSIEKSERLSGMLKRRGVKHVVLNAKYHEQEAEIVAQAGRKGVVTIATNMAGRGTDILLGGNPEHLAKQHLRDRETPPENATKEQWDEGLATVRPIVEREHDEVVALGGLHILGTERHEARRIDNQLRGRAGRQGDPGSSRFYLSLEDDLMRIFGSDRISGLMQRLGMEEGVPIEHNMVTKAIERAQKQVEAQNFSVRKHLLEYDDVMNKQREAIYAERRQILEGADQRGFLEELGEELVDELVDTHFGKDTDPEEWDFDGFKTAVSTQYGLEESDFSGIDPHTVSPDELRDSLWERIKGKYEAKRQLLGPELMQRIERDIMLQIVDAQWKDHLYSMDHLKEGIGLRGYGQRDPLVEYKKESFTMFQAMRERVDEEIVRYLWRLRPEWSADSPPTARRREPRRPPALLLNTFDPAGEPVGAFAGASRSAGAAVASRRPPRMGGDDAPIQTVRRDEPKVGRNDPCPCGSGKKYKKCHGA